jgi:hypothetical protein
VHDRRADFEWQAGDERVQHAAEGGLADPAEGETGDGDAQLGGGDVGVEVIDAVENPGGPAVAFRG